MVISRTFKIVIVASVTEEEIFSSRLISILCLAQTRFKDPGLVSHSVFVWADGRT
jgi:hypothetical protein